MLRLLRQMSNFIVAPIANSEWFIGNSHEKNIVKKKQKNFHTCWQQTANAEIEELQLG